MSNTVAISENTVSCLMDGSSPLNLMDELGVTTAILIQRIDFASNNTDDSVTVRDGGHSAGAVMWRFKDVGNTGGGIDFGAGKRCKPFIVGSEVTANTIVIFTLG